MHSKIRGRTQKFTSLRAAQRALARIVHPAVLSDVREQGRQLLIELQALSEWRKGGDPDFAGVDALLADQTTQTLELIGRVEFSQLHAKAHRLCLDHPDEVCSLVDVLTEGDLSQDKNLRLLEYLITMLSVEEWNGRRTLVKEPTEIAPGLRALTRQALADPSIDAEASERFLEDAMSRLIRGTDHHVIRDEVRDYKQKLGRDFLHPRILPRVAAYNVAMWNQVAARIDGDLAVDQLADELLADLPQQDVAADALTAPAAGTATQVLGSAAFESLVVAFQVRVRGDAVSDETARRIVETFSLDGLRPMEVEALESDDTDPVTTSIRRAVVLGRILRQSEALRDRLEAIGLDPLHLEADGLEELTGEMTAMGRKLFLDSRYDDAFALSEAKTRNLAALSARLRGGADGGGTLRRDAPGIPAGVRAYRTRFDWNLTPGRISAIVGGIVGFALLMFTVSPLRSDVAIVSSRALSHVSPFLESGRRYAHEGQVRFVGELSPAWNYLGTSERREVASEIAEYFAAGGVETVILRGRGNSLLARWEDGELAQLTPKR